MAQQRQVAALKQRHKAQAAQPATDNDTAPSRVTHVVARPAAARQPPPGGERKPSEPVAGRFTSNNPKRKKTLADFDAGRKKGGGQLVLGAPLGRQQCSLYGDNDGLLASALALSMSADPGAADAKAAAATEQTRQEDEAAAKAAATATADAQAAADVYVEATTLETATADATPEAAATDATQELARISSSISREMRVLREKLEAQETEKRELRARFEREHALLEQKLALERERAAELASTNKELQTINRELQARVEKELNKEASQSVFDGIFSFFGGGGDDKEGGNGDGWGNGRRLGGGGGGGGSGDRQR